MAGLSVVWFDKETRRELSESTGTLCDFFGGLVFDDVETSHLECIFQGSNVLDNVVVVNIDIEANVL